MEINSRCSQFRISITILILFLSTKMEATTNTPSGLVLSGGLGVGRYENITMARGHTYTLGSPTDLGTNGTIFGIGIASTFLMFDIDACLKGYSVAYTRNDSARAANDPGVTFKGGVHILPSKWAIQLTPEIGYFYINEYVVVSCNNVDVYREELKDKWFLIGASNTWRINNTNCFKFSYFHSHNNQVEIDNYSLQWRRFLWGKQEDYFGYFGFEGQLSTKSDGRKSYGISFISGLNLLKANQMDKERKEDKKKAKEKADKIKEINKK